MVERNRRSKPSNRVLWSLGGLIALAGSVQSFGQAPRDRQPVVNAGVPATLKLRTGEVETVFAAETLTELAVEARNNRKARSVLQLDGPMTPARRAALEDAGITIGHYLPPDSFVVQLDKADPIKMGRLNFVRWQSRYEREWKLDAEIGNRPYTTPERIEENRQGLVSVVIHVFDNEPLGPVVDSISAIDGAQVTSASSIDGVHTITATMKFNDTVLLADLPEVAFVEDAPENTERSNTNNRWIVQSNINGVTPLYSNGLRGEGQIVGVIDSQVDMNHCSFRDNVNNTPGPGHRKVLAYNTTQSSVFHGTHVAGTVAGDNGVDNDTRGIAYLAKIVFNTIPSQTEAGVTQRLDLHYSQGARIHTNSWGDDGTTAYTGQCRGIDAHMYNNEDSLVLFASTNLSTLKTPENAKNVLAVGASQGSPNQGSFCSGGTGPTNDGRRKPEIFAPGCSTLSSSAGTACSTTSSTGTSMACPAVAGTAALVRQYFTDGFYPSGAANPTDSFVPSGALLKATLLNSSVDMTNITGYPSNQEGWGRVLADSALHFTGDTRKLWLQDVRNAQGLSTGTVIEQGLNVISGAESFEITLVWTEPAAAANANPAYINNLDLEVVGPGGELYLGNVFSGGQSTTGGTADFRNNVESVLIQTPTPGAYILRIRATAVNQGTQGYAIVATGDITEGPRPLSIFASNLPTLVPPGQSTEIQVVVNAGDDTLVANSPTVYYRASAGDVYTSAPLTPLGGNDYKATLPGFACEDSPQFYVSAEGLATGVVYSPFQGESGPSGYSIGVITVGFEDEIETDQGWTVGDVTDTATTGIWERVVPIGTNYEPSNDHTEAGTFCFLTGQHTQGQAAGFNDVDGGATTLFSPVFDLSTLGAPVISYWRWFYGTSGDLFTVSISNDGGSSWTQVTSLNVGTGGWTFASFSPTDYVSLTNQMRLRFVCNDTGSGSFVEGALDDVLITAYECINPPPPNCEGDANGDLVVDFADITSILQNWGSSGPMGDANGSESVDFKDITMVLINYGTNCL